MRQLFSIFLLFPLIVWAQDSTQVRKIKYNPDFKFTDGIYLSFEDVKHNNPIIKERIITDLSYDDYAFFEKLLDGAETITVLDAMGLRKEIPVNDIWGFSQNGIIYIRWNDAFNRIPVLGSISHFIADKTYIQSHSNYPYNNYYYNPYNPYSMYPQDYQTKQTELRQYLLDMDTGKVIDYSDKNLEAILMRDPDLYQEFMSLKKKERRKLKFLFLRKYNEKHPLYIYQKTN